MKRTLTAKNVWTAPTPKFGQVEYADKDLPGFALRVTSKGVRSFVLHYRPKQGEHRGRLTRWTIGRLTKDFGLAQARDIARDARVRIRDQNADPARENKILVQDDGGPETYREAVDDYIEKYQIGKKRNRTADEVKRLLLKEGAHWLERPISEITRREIHDLLDGLIAEDNPYLANRTFAALRTLFSWCVKRDKIDHSPCEGVERPFDGEKPRDRHYSDDEIKAIWMAADEISGFKGPLLKVCLLTGKRKNEVAKLRRGEIDLEAETWTLPEGRSKNKREHVMPLPSLAVRILKAVPRVEGTDLVFPGRKSDRPMSGWTQFQQQVQRLSGVADFTFHAFRHTLKTRLGKLGVLPHIKDKLLHHTPPRSAGEDYDHYDYQSEQREGIEKWADHVASIVWPKNVEALHG